MALKIRLRQQGKRNQPFYRLVVTDSQSRRDGIYREAIGWYNPMQNEQEKNIFVKADRVQHWLDNGAILSEKARCLVMRAAPEVANRLREKELAHRAKMTAKRKEKSKA